MKKNTLLHLCVAGILFTTLLFISCGKSIPGGRTFSFFTWTVDGQTYVADTDTAFTNDIEATKAAGTQLLHLEIAIHSANNFPVGSYPLGAGADLIGYWDENIPSGGGRFSMSGTLNITASSFDEVSGDFTTLLSDGSTMTGNFSHVPTE